MMLIGEQEVHLKEKQRRAEEKRNIKLKEKVRKAQEEEAKVFVSLTQYLANLYMRLFFQHIADYLGYFSGE